jgi:hypothetical protein
MEHQYTSLSIADNEPAVGVLGSKVKDTSEGGRTIPSDTVAPKYEFL